MSTKTWGRLALAAFLGLPILSWVLAGLMSPVSLGFLGTFVTVMLYPATVLVVQITSGIGKAIVALFRSDTVKPRSGNALPVGSAVTGACVGLVAAAAVTTFSAHAFRDIGVIYGVLGLAYGVLVDRFVAHGAVVGVGDGSP